MKKLNIRNINKNHLWKGGFYILAYGYLFILKSWLTYWT